MDQMLNDFETLWRTLQTFNDAHQGTTRIAFTDTDRRSRLWIQEVWTNRGLSTFVDGIGNVVGLLGGPPYLLLGSHTDSVPGGGSFDGILGVLAATSVVRRWNGRDGGLMLVDWSCEESSRFGISTLGSRFALGEHKTDYLDAIDSSGIVLADAIRGTYGYPDVPILDLRQYRVKAALELHMEQGNQLEERNCPLALVTAIAAPQRWRVTVEGMASHSAGTAMMRRSDALAAFSELTLAIETLSKHLEEAGLRTTATNASVWPGVPNVIAGRVTGVIDVRAQSLAVLAHYREALAVVCRDISTRRKVHISLSEISGEAPGELDPAILELIRQVLKNRGLPMMQIPSWASHDSLPLSRHVPVGMLFVRNPSGLSHTARESLNREDIGLALDVFYDVVELIQRHMAR